MVLIALMIVPLLVTGGDRAAIIQDVGAQTAYCATEAEAEMLRRINELRQQNGLAPLALSQPLGVAAESKASDMAERNYLAHVSPEGQDPRDLLTSVGYPSNTSTGENLAAGNSGAAGTFEQWLNSPSHRATMLGGQFTAVGIGVAYDPDSRYGWYWTTIFGGVVGTPAGTCDGDSPIEPPVTPPVASPIDALIAVLVAILVRIFAG